MARGALCRGSRKGFTLLEVMVAMAVLAIAGMSVMGMVRESISNTQYLAEKRPAFWVAENAMTDIVLSQRWPGREWQKSSTVLAEREWFIRSRKVKTGSDDLIMLEVEVRQKKDSESALASLQTYVLDS
ncbi:type II secretion system protein GspI [Endozoicomonas sp. OPT23]|uniref:type II secretion system minor pseudopilin GspI n=1 Tax=Endozoicomonas sp. OPT23 TaxID=2072845 RepID=UPI00129AE016|nr:type II secretion system minor pseudopilin GspI [Endozoicomonas sp. OPT23]MRI32231.1 type II secretion system protein GspI [Endozoicomonas sp. OPT23]